jgi:hypothetical protein
MWDLAFSRAREYSFLLEDAAKMTFTWLSTFTALRVISSGSPGPTPTPYKVPGFIIAILLPDV